MRRMKQVEIELTEDQRNKVERIFGGLQNTNQINPATSIKCKFVAV